jgi:hypothetical protein
MENTSTDQALRQSLRTEICPICPMRPPGSASLGPLIARSCEPGCPIFTNLEALKQIAAGGADNPLAAYERAIRQQVCQTCAASTTAGDFCYEGFSRTCPLSVMAPNVLLLIESHTSGTTAPPSGGAETPPRKKTDPR